MITGFGHEAARNLKFGAGYISRIHSRASIRRFTATMSSKAGSSIDLSSLKTPEKCVADFCLIPLGTPTASVSAQIADVQRLMKASGIDYSMHSAGTTIEGTWDEVMKVIGQAHFMLHEKGIVRIQTDIRVGSRIDKKQHYSEKVSAVEKLLAQD